ncbi:CG3781 [Drosophila busckii]|uniref:Josephin-2 n=1 Tax=Drosophila busckii TaxID=30019 RepID=A0A0M4EB42_DROBS|nr:josephin-like protein [Drosophila busckii]ALC40677.1 CG3781 [Drosophila busckii]
MSTSSVYHEKQMRQLCALHALNNLFQGDHSYTKTELDNICNNLSPNVWVNPHRSLLGLGNYDINVIMTALQKRNFEAVWFDKRKDPCCINFDETYGFILNIPSDYKFGIVTLPLRRRHWIAVRRIGDNYYNLDSKLHQPELIGNESDTLQFFREQLTQENQQRELFIILEHKEDKTTAQRWEKKKNILLPFSQ